MELSAMEPSDRISHTPPDEKINASEHAASVHAEKEQAILTACKWKDIDSLRVLAESPGGFLKDDLRRHACKSPHLNDQEPNHHLTPRRSGERAPPFPPCHFLFSITQLL